VVVGVVVLLLVFVGVVLFGMHQHAREVEENRRWFEEQRQRRDQEFDNKWKQEQGR
jgi:hypothetical protein